MAEGQNILYIYCILELKNKNYFKKLKEWKYFVCLKTLVLNKLKLKIRHLELYENEGLRKTIIKTENILA